MLEELAALQPCSCNPAIFALPLVVSWKRKWELYEVWEM